jgi:methylenetetrahydrofolate dehydrogenase (NADP+)/methenyltetrahydrofolate cyclohydrolase
VDGKIQGDVDFDNVYEKAGYITPMPGGTGPMTIACLLENTLKCYLESVSKND